MQPEAQRILQVFAAQNAQAGDLIAYLDFGDALPLENGHIEEETVLAALASLIQEEYVQQATRGLVLTEKGHRFLVTGTAAPEATPEAQPKATAAEPVENDEAWDVLLSAVQPPTEAPAPPDPTDAPSTPTAPSPRDLAAAISTKAADLQKHLLWKTDDEVERLLADPESRAALEADMANVLIYALHFCDRIGMDPLAIIQRNLAAS